MLCPHAAFVGRCRFQSHNQSQENGEEEKSAVEDVINVQHAVLELLAGNKAVHAPPTPLNVSVGGGGAARSRTDALNIKELVLEMLSVNAKNQPPPASSAAAGATVKNSDGSLTAQV